MRVQAFQNWLYDQNPTWQLTDAQLLAILRVEFPVAGADLFTGDVDTGCTTSEACGPTTTVTTTTGHRPPPGECLCL